MSEWCPESEPSIAHLETVVSLRDAKKLLQ